VWQPPMLEETSVGDGVKFTAQMDDLGHRLELDDSFSICSLQNGHRGPQSVFRTIAIEAKFTGPIGTGVFLQLYYGLLCAREIPSA